MGAGYNSADGHMVELFFWRCRFLLFVNGKQHAFDKQCCQLL